MQGNQPNNKTSQFPTPGLGPREGEGGGRSIEHQFEDASLSKQKKWHFVIVDNEHRFEQHSQKSPDDSF